MEVPLFVEVDATTVKHEEDCLMQDSAQMRRDQAAGGGRSGRPGSREADCTRRCHRSTSPRTGSDPFRSSFHSNFATSIDRLPATSVSLSPTASHTYSQPASLLIAGCFLLFSTCSSRACITVCIDSILLRSAQHRNRVPRPVQSRCLLLFLPVKLLPLPFPQKLEPSVETVALPANSINQSLAEHPLRSRHCRGLPRAGTRTLENCILGHLN
ncbi:hypothetical protein B296_00052296 [Ensete ventricosum]|uniref:Uncharacterized protein n=1 Tax=Ensete ventricosum TaxID=4639 RepID=A0A426X2J0_ENSVE|nr:hypothetical protein B296_00052296 [Ensete ventricosum]